MPSDRLIPTKSLLPPLTLLLIACGNSLRRDDGAGLVLAEMLEQAWRSKGIETRSITVQQLLPELAAEIAWQKVSAVVFVDTIATLDTTEFSLQAYTLVPAIPSPSLSHQLQPAILLSYAKLLYGQCPPAWLVTVPGIDFGHGEGLSEATRQVLTMVPMLAADLLMRISDPN